MYTKVSAIRRMLLTFSLFFAVVVALPTAAQTTVLSPDSLSVFPAPNDTLQTDSVKSDIKNDSIQKKEEHFDAEITYAGSDSIVFFGTGLGYIYGEAQLQYKEMDLSQASYLRIVMDSTTIYAYSTPDSTGTLVGKPIFKDHNSEYISNEIAYNFRTRRGFVKQAVTEEGEGYIISKRTKIIDNNILNIADGMYTTCDLHDHPHFYMSLKRAKAKPGEYIVTGPVQLHLLDIPLPVALPFGFFPFNTNYSSGLEMPSFDTEYTRGYGLTNGGYYFAISDYMDMSLKGDIYAKGTWGLNLTTNYLSRYKYNGGIGISYRVDVIGEKGLPEYNQAKNLSVRWSHSQSPKVNPFRTFSASVNFATSGYNRSNINSYYSEVKAENTKSSSISFSQRFPNNPFSITANMGIDQRTKDSTVSLNLPNIAVSMSRIHPLKFKNRVGKERWYEKITMSYSGNISNNITTKENQLLQSSFADDWRNGVQHNIPISASFNILNYINISPSISYKERWYLNSTTRTWNEESGKVEETRNKGFHRVYDFNGSISANTTLYGMFIPSRKLFGDKIVAVRHKFDPSVGFSYNPDFGDPRWGYYDSYQRPYTDPNDPKNTLYEEIFYSHFDREMYGTPGRGKSGSVNFSMGNNIEMKLKNKNDTTGTNPTRIVSLIDQFSLSSGYNLAADSMHWQNFSGNLKIKAGKKFNINLVGAFDPYMYGLGPDGKSVRRVNQLRWNHGKFPRFLGTSLSPSFTLNNATFQRKDRDKRKGSSDDDDDLYDGLEGGAFENDPNNPHSSHSLDVVSRGTNQNLEKGEVNNEGYEEVKIPWSLTFSYSVRFGDGHEFNYDKMEYNRKFTQSLRVNGNIQLTPGWNISGSSTYDFTAKKITSMIFNVSRNLHCWTMTANFVPFGPIKTYNFRIGVNSSMLSDLKIEKSSARGGAASNVTWY